MSTYKSVYQEFVSELPKRKGYIILMCPKCLSVVKTIETTITPLNKWAYTYGDKKDTSYQNDGRGCCF